MLFRSALFTDANGKLLSSEYFNPEINSITALNYRGDDWFKRILDLKLSKSILSDSNEYIKFYTVYSFMENSKSQDIGTIIYLTDPAFRTDEFQFKLQQIKAHFKSEKVKPKKETLTSNLFHCEPFANKRPIDTYGKEFTRDIFYSSIFDLLDPQLQIYKKRTQTLIMKYFQYFNGISKGINYEDFELGPSIDDVNYALKKLGFAKLELESFLWLRQDRGFKFDQTRKEWLKLISEKLITYYESNTIDDGSIFFREGKRLSELLTEKEYDPLDQDSIVRDKEKFTITEARYGKQVYESAKNIFGHFTIRLIFAHMIDYYGSEGDFGLKVINRDPIEAREKAKLLPVDKRAYLRDFLLHNGIITSTNQYDRPLSRLVSLETTMMHLFGYFILESHSYLPIEGIVDVQEDFNTLSFNLGPLVALTASGGFYGKDVNELSRNIGEYLRLSYNKYRMDNLETSDAGILGKRFLETSDKSFQFFAEKIRKQIVDLKYYSRLDKNLWLAEQIIRELRQGLIFEKTPSKSSGHLKAQLEKFMDTADKASQQREFNLKFNYIIPKSGKEFVLKITQDDLVQSEFIGWGRRAKLDSKEYSQYRGQLLAQNNDNIINYLSKIIKIYGHDEKVRIFPLYDTKDPDFGYQYLEQIDDRGNLMFLPRDKGYIDINLREETDHYKLIHVVNLLHTGKYAFFMK